MKILLHYPEWSNRWVPYIEKELNQYDLTVTHTSDGGKLGDLSDKADLLISMWMNEITAFWSQYFPDKKIISYLRRYEFWEPDLLNAINFEAVNAIIFVSEYYHKVFNRLMGLDFKGRLSPETKQHVIPNVINFDDFKPIKPKKNSKKIAMVCLIKNVKNIPLACQILLALPEEFTIHQIGLPAGSQIAGQITSYIDSLGLMDRFKMEGVISSNKVYNWLKDKRCLLSTSINEGNPNNVIEAMAMGIKPIVHDWPGARDQFPENLIFRTVDEAASLILDSSYRPAFYRRWVQDKYSIKNYEKLHAVIKEVMEDD